MDEPGGDRDEAGQTSPAGGRQPVTRAGGRQAVTRAAAWLLVGSALAPLVLAAEVLRRIVERQGPRPLLGVDGSVLTRASLVVLSSPTPVLLPLSLLPLAGLVWLVHARRPRGPLPGPLVVTAVATAGVLAVAALVTAALAVHLVLPPGADDLPRLFVAQRDLLETTAPALAAGLVVAVCAGLLGVALLRPSLLRGDEPVVPAATGQAPPGRTEDAAPRAPAGDLDAEPEPEPEPAVVHPLPQPPHPQPPHPQAPQGQAPPRQTRADDDPHAGFRRPA